ncbi:MAG: hypothetical protein J3K34DRAFT_497843 [Monoraphidium minutum]|nr:MAG: hypothetical protein J3K34DRAFT_497843 [Monoraphidium minutum]
MLGGLRAAAHLRAASSALRSGYSSVTAAADAEAGSSPKPGSSGGSGAAAAEEGEAGRAAAGAGGGAAHADGAPSSSGRAPHITLDHPDLRAYLNHNTVFKTDEERLYKVGMIAAMDRKGRTELRKALAAHRLALRDAAAAPPRGARAPAGLQDRMAARLVEMEAELRRVEGAAQR